jgi:glucosamine--fructose-6-phosphate aminotransferase (isomerizing)
MCGIIGMTSKQPFGVKKDLLEALRRLEYRGYDSFGFATMEGRLVKMKGQISDFISGIEEGQTICAIAHTRWATHGGVSDINAHPHRDCSGTIFVAHNGIIENYLDFREELAKKGHTFLSETDSEIIAHFFEERLKDKSMKEVCKEFIRKAEGTFAIVILRQGSDEIAALKRDSPLALGILPEKKILGSDLYAFSTTTDRAIFFEDDEFALITPESYQFFNRSGKVIKKTPHKFIWTQKTEEKKNFPHFMLKEIWEEPAVAQRLTTSLAGEQKEKLHRLVSLIKKSDRILFAACGTAYFATLLGVFYLNKCGIESHTLIASEFPHYAFADRKTLVIAVSQSGETMDVIQALKYARERGATIASIVNVPHSSVQRMSKLSLEILAGQEICVASTKAFTNQSLTLLALARQLGLKCSLSPIPSKMEKALRDNENTAKSLARELFPINDTYILGRGASYPVAREIAHKIKETSYNHAEGIMGGELKHCELALVSQGTPVISLVPDWDHDMVSNTKEVEARGARVITLSNKPPADFLVPECTESEFPLIATPVGHLLAYWIANYKGCEIDKPRNLAKSVTVK